jgi:hypothetical protein
VLGELAEQWARGQIHATRDGRSAKSKGLRELARESGGIVAFVLIGIGVILAFVILFDSVIGKLGPKR